MKNIVTSVSKLLLGSAFLFTGAVVGTAEAQSGKPIMITAKREMAAFLDGPKCAESVKMIFKGKKVEYFQSDQPIAARLIYNIAALIKAQCADVTLISARGIVQDRIVYTGLAEASTDWRVAELGVSNNIGNLSGGRKAGAGAGEKSEFRKNGNFLSLAKIVELGQNTPFICTRYDAATNSCSAITNLGDLTAKGGKIIVSSLIKANGDPELRLTDTVSSNDGFMCLNPQQSTTKVIGGNLSAGARSTMETDFKERAEDKGDEICIGYQKSGDKIITEYFDKDGYSLSSQSEVTLTKTALSLRFDD